MFKMENYSFNNPPENPLLIKDFKKLYQKQEELTEEQKKKLAYYIDLKRKVDPHSEKLIEAKYIAKQSGLMV